MQMIQFSLKNSFMHYDLSIVTQRLTGTMFLVSNEWDKQIIYWSNKIIFAENCPLFL